MEISRRGFLKFLGTASVVAVAAPKIAPTLVTEGSQAAHARMQSVLTAYYSKNFTENLKRNMATCAMFQKIPIPENQGKTINFTIYPLYVEPLKRAGVIDSRGNFDDRRFDALLG